MAYKTVIIILVLGIALSLTVRLLGPHERDISYTFNIPFKWSHPPHESGQTPYVGYSINTSKVWSWIVLGGSFALGWGIAFGHLVYCYFCARHMAAKLPPPPGL